MDTAITIEQPYMNAGALVEGRAAPFHLPHPVPEASLFIDVPDFKFRFQVPLTDLTEFVGSTQVNIRFAVDSNVALMLALTGEPIEEGAKFQPHEGQVSFQLADEKGARAQFIGSTLLAMFGLAGEVPLRVPEIDLNIGMHFDLPLSLISRILLNRQLSYALMVIGAATGKRFKILSDKFSDKNELDSLTFAYQAIVERSFLWPVGLLSVTLLATEESLSRVSLDSQPFPFTTDPKMVFAPVLDQVIALGEGKLFIDQTIIRNLEEVQQELSMKDGHPVEIIIESLSGQARFEFPDAPRLPQEAWDWRLQALINLEPQLNERLAAAYNELAAATLADLTDEEKAQVTERPDLDADAHLMSD